MVEGVQPNRMLTGSSNNNNNNNNNNNFIYIALKSNNCPKRFLITILKINKINGIKYLQCTI